MGLVFKDDNSNDQNSLSNSWNSSYMSIPYRGDPHEMAKLAADNYKLQFGPIFKVKML